MRWLFGTIGLTRLVAVAAPVAVAIVVAVASSAQAAHASKSQSPAVLAGSARGSTALKRSGRWPVAAAARTRGPVVESFSLDEGTVLSAGGKVLVSITTAGANRCVISASPVIKGLRSVVPCGRGMTFVSFNIPPNHRDAVVRYHISVRGTRRGVSSPVVTGGLLELPASRSSSSPVGAAQAASPFASPGDFAKFALDKALRYAAGKVGVPGDALGFLLQQVGLEAKPEGFKPVLDPLEKLAGGIDTLQNSLNAFQVFANDDAFKAWSALNQNVVLNLTVMEQYLGNIAALVQKDPGNKDPNTQTGITDNVRDFLQGYYKNKTEFQGDINRFAGWLGVSRGTFTPDYDALDLFGRYELHGRRYATSRDSDQIRLFAGYVKNLQAAALAINELALGKPPESCGIDTTSALCGNHNTSQAINIANEYVQDVSQENARLPLPIPQNAVVDLQATTTTTDKLMWLPALGGGTFSIHLLTWWLPVKAGVSLPTYPQFPTPRKAGVLPTYTYLQYEATSAPSGNQTDNSTDPPTSHEAPQAGFANWVVASRDQIRNFVGHSAVNYNPAMALGSYLQTIDPGSSWDHLAGHLVTSTTIGYTVPVTNSLCPSGFDVTTPGFFDLAKAQSIDTNFYHQGAPVDIQTDNVALCASKTITDTSFLRYDFNDVGSVLLERTVDPHHAMGVDYLGNQVAGSPGAGENIYTRADLEGANLSGLDLSGPLNPQTDSAGAPIKGDAALFANFTAANLTRANLAGDNLSGQNFNGANLTDANLKGADLSNANLSTAALEGVSSGGITLQSDANAPTLPFGWVLAHGYLVGPHANLAGANLTGADLSGANLTGANLTGAYLTGADLTGAHLDGARLIDANLLNANLDRTTLTDATLELVKSGGISGTPSRLPNHWLLTANGYLVGPRANLQGANLKGQVLTGSDSSGALFNNANLEGAHLTGATITGATFTGAQLGGVQSGGLIGTPATTPLPIYVGGVQVVLENLPTNWKVMKGYLIGPSADLAGANLDGTDFTDAHVNAFKLQPLSLAGANLTNAHLVGANLAGVNLKGAILSGADLKNANLTTADLAGATITDASFAGARLDGVRSGGLVGTPSTYQLPAGNVVLTFENLPANWKVVKGYLVGPSADLSGANLDGADFTDAHVNPGHGQPLSLAGARLTNAHLVGANLAGVNLKGAILSGVDLSKANLTNANLSGASNLASAHIDATTVWANTTCPDGTNSNTHGQTCVGH